MEAFLNIKTRNTHRYNGFFHRSPLSSQRENYERIFEQWSELQVAKFLIVHVLSSSYNFSSFQLWNEKKATQHWGPRVVNGFVPNQVRVYHERVYADNVVSKLWFVKSFSSQHDFQFIANIATENVY